LGPRTDAMMLRRILQVCGALALVLWTAGGVAAWMLTRQQLHVTVLADGEQASRQDERMALLRDELGVLARDVAALRDATRTGCGQLAATLAEDAAEREHAAGAAAADAQQRAAGLAALATRIASLEATVARGLAAAADSRPATAAKEPVAEPSAPAAER